MDGLLLQEGFYSFGDQPALAAFKKWVQQQTNSLQLPAKVVIDDDTPQGVEWLVSRAVELGIMTWDVIPLKDEPERVASVVSVGPGTTVVTTALASAPLTAPTWTYVDYGRDDPKLWGAPSSRYKADGMRYPWADDVTDASRAKMLFNAQDGTTNRMSHVADYPVTHDNWPIWLHAFVHGSTGKKGPGKLGKLGPNHAADPVAIEVRDIELPGSDGECDEDNIMQRVAAAIAACTDTNLAWFGVVMIQRTDRGERGAPDNEWAIPGGMCDPQDPDVSVTLIRELMEEALAGLPTDVPTTFKQGYKDEYVRFLYDRVKKGIDVFRGFNVSDPRNTDNAWMETVVRAICINDMYICKRLKHGSDASKVAMIDVAVDITTGEIVSATYKGDPIVFYSDHKQFVAAACMALWTARP
jgi:hypothetical protein